MAKIETPFGVTNLREIARSTEGMIIARDDLYAYYNKSQVANIAQQVIDVCKEEKKVSIPASNYFVSLCTSISDEENRALHELCNAHQK